MNKEKKESKKEKEFNQIIKDLSFSIRIQEYDTKEETQKFKKLIEKLEEKLELMKKFPNNEQLQQLKDELQNIKESITVINTNEENNNESGLEKINESGLEKINASGLEKINKSGLEKINEEELEKNIQLISDLANYLGKKYEENKKKYQNMKKI